MTQPPPPWILYSGRVMNAFARVSRPHRLPLHPSLGWWRPHQAVAATTVPHHIQTRASSSSSSQSSQHSSLHPSRRRREPPKSNIRYSMHYRGRRTPFELRKVHPVQLPSHTYGFSLLKDPFYNKGTAFPERERDRLGLRGLLPPAIIPLELQLKRVYEAFKRTGVHPTKDGKPDKMAEMVAKHIFLGNLHDRNETLFYKLIVDNIMEMAPIIYTPTVGYACLHASTLFRQARGLYLSGFSDRSDYHSIIRNWPVDDVDVIVMTDGSRVLGLGDLGVNGMPIPVGKLSLYVAAGGIDPTKCLPIMLDMGTNNTEILEDELYLGTKKRRLEGEVYFEVMDQVMDAIVERYPNAVIQFEDFKTPYAEALLNRYRKKCTMFNDDIQGTGTMCLAGIMTALRVKARSLRKSLAAGNNHPEYEGFQLPESRKDLLEAAAAIDSRSASATDKIPTSFKEILSQAFAAEEFMEQDDLFVKPGEDPEEIPLPARFKEQRVVSLGAGSAGLGVCAKLHQGMVMDGLTKQQAYDRIFLVDKDGLITSNRKYLEPGQKRYAVKSYQVEGLGLEEGSDLLEVVRSVKPTILLGLSGVGQTFTREVLEEMAKHVERPIIFSMSNPTDRSECTAEQAYEFTGGRAIFASGSPFPDVVRDDSTAMAVSQANNMYVFPGIGLGAVASRAKTITAEMLYVAALELSAAVTDDLIEEGRVFPPLDRIRQVSLRIAAGVAKEAEAAGLARQFPADNETWEEYIDDIMWKPVYRPLVWEPTR